MKPKKGLLIEREDCIQSRQGDDRIVNSEKNQIYKIVH